MLTASDIKHLLASRNIAPNKRLGQNFLVEQKALEELMGVARLSKDDAVVEVGAGVGTITIELAERAGTIFAIEKDTRLIPLLYEQTKNCNNIKIIEGDALDFHIPDLDAQSPGAVSAKSGIDKYKLVCAPPYYLTARLFRKFLAEERLRPSLIALIIQKEVAQKICAEAPRMNLLALSVQLYGTPRIVRAVSRGAFWPPPDVDSAILVVETREHPAVPSDSTALFFKIAKAAFLHPRQQLQKTLSQGLNISRELTKEWLSKNGIDAIRRPATLTVEDWRNLVSTYPL